MLYSLYMNYNYCFRRKQHSYATYNVQHCAYLYIISYHIKFNKGRKHDLLFKQNTKYLQTNSFKPNIFIFGTSVCTFHDEVTCFLNVTCHLFESSCRYPPYIVIDIHCIFNSIILDHYFLDFYRFGRIIYKQKVKINKK